MSDKRHTLQVECSIFSIGSFSPKDNSAKIRVDEVGAFVKFIGSFELLTGRVLLLPLQGTTVKALKFSLVWSVF